MARYSGPNVAGTAATKFPWEYPVPDDDFWNSLEYTTCRNFLECFSEDEIQSKRFDASLSQEEKLQLLLELVQQKHATEDAAASPQTLYDVDFAAWKQVMLAIITVYGALGQIGRQEEVIRIVIDRNKDKTNLSFQHNLAAVLKKQGRWAEAEEMELQVLPWLESHPMLGKDSPQALSARRLIATAQWKQGRREEAEKTVTELKSLIAEMSTGKFAAYQADEEAAIEEMTSGWKE